MTKLDYEKDNRKRTPKEHGTDGHVPLLLGKVIVSPKVTVTEAKRNTQCNVEKLKEKLAFLASEEFDGIISTSKKKHLLKEIEDLIHALRASTYRSARLSDADSLIIKARAVVKLRRSLLPSQPSKGLGLSPIPRSKDQTRKKTRASRKRNPR